MSRKGLAAVTRYTVHYARDESGSWIATVPRVRGCHTYGRSLDEARRRIREALGLFVAGAQCCQLVDRVELRPEVSSLLARVRRTRRRAETERSRAAAATRQAARTLTRDLRLGVRDTGELLGLSHQRVHQLVTERTR